MGKQKASVFVTSLALLASAASWGASPLPLAQVAESEAFLALPEASVSVEGNVQVTGTSIAGIVGDEFELLVDKLGLADGQDGKVTPFPSAKDSLDQGFLVRGPMTRQSDGKRRVRIGLVGSIKDRALSLRFEDASGKALARSTSLILNVVDPPLKAGPSGVPEKNPPIDALRLPFPWWALALGLVVLAVCFGTGLWFLLRWSRTRQPEALPVLVAPERPEDVAALDALAAIERQEWMKKRLYKPHFFAVSETLKRYLGKRFNVNALESTSAELVELLRQSAVLTDRELLVVNRLFDRLDWIKFTDAVPEEAEGSEVVQSVRQLIFQTRRSPLAAVQAGSGVVNATGPTVQSPFRAEKGAP